MSDEDIAAGTRWSEEIGSKLEASAFGIVVATPHNLERPWLSFEAGALAKALDTARVCPLAIGMTLSEITGPLAQFQGVTTSIDDLTKLINSINDASSAPLDEGRIEAALEMSLAPMKDALDEAARSAGPAPKMKKATKRSNDDMLEELIELSRSIERHLVRGAVQSADARPFRRGYRVLHDSFGPGDIIDMDGDFAIIEFADGVLRKISIPHAPMRRIARRRLPESEAAPAEVAPPDSESRPAKPVARRAVPRVKAPVDPTTEN